MAFPTLELLTGQPKTSHKALKDRLSQAEDCSGCRSPLEGGEPLSADEETALIRGRSTLAPRHHGMSGRCLTILILTRPSVSHNHRHLRKHRRRRSPECRRTANPRQLRTCSPPFLNVPR